MVSDYDLNFGKNKYGEAAYCGGAGSSFAPLQRVCEGDRVSLRSSKTSLR